MISLRPAEARDWARLYVWRNDPATRAASRHSEPIPLERHIGWFRAALSNAEVAIYIAEADGSAVGMLRIDRRGADAELSIVVDPVSRRKRAAALMLDTAVQLARTAGATGAVRAMVHIDNAASLRAFASAGFEFASIAGEFATLERPL